MEIKPIHTGSSGNLYIIKTLKEDLYLLECGLEKGRITKGLFRNGLLISYFKGAFISHNHEDHIRSAKWVNSYMPIYSNRQVMSKGFKGEVLEQNKKKQFNDFFVIPFNVEHGNAENYAYIFKDEIDTILFATDFYTFSANISGIKFTKLYIECNWTTNLMNEYLEEYKDSADYQKYERQYNTHCGLNVLIDLLTSLDLTQCKQITLIHASKECCDKEEALIKIKTLFPQIDVNFAVNERW